MINNFGQGRINFPPRVKESRSLGGGGGGGRGILFMRSCVGGSLDRDNTVKRADGTS